MIDTQHFVVHNAGVCEGESKTGFDIDIMQDASSLWIKQLLAKIISKHVELIANHGDKERVVEVNASSSVPVRALCVHTFT